MQFAGAIRRRTSPMQFAGAIRRRTSPMQFADALRRCNSPAQFAAAIRRCNSPTTCPTQFDDDDGDDDDDALDEEERRELVRKRRLHLQRRAEAAKKRAQHLRSAAAARAVDEQREKAEREAKDAIFEKPPPVPPVPPGGNIFRLQLRGPFKAHGGAKQGQIYSETRDEGAAWRVGWMSHGAAMKKFFVRLAGPLVDEASGLLCTSRGDVRALSMHRFGDARLRLLRPAASLGTRSRGIAPPTLLPRRVAPNDYIVTSPLPPAAYPNPHAHA